MDPSANERRGCPVTESNMALDRSIYQRGAQARQNLAAALRECCELADAVDQFEGDELLDVLLYIDRLRYVMADSGQLLQGVVRGNEG